MNPCPTCDAVGPNLPLSAALYGFHRACHQFTNALLQPLANLLDRATRRRP